MPSIRTSHEPDHGAHDLPVDLKPFINFLVVLVPVLMLSAEFQKVSVIRASAYPGGASANRIATQRPCDIRTDKLGLTVMVTDSTITLAASGSFMPTMWYREMHEYVASDNRHAGRIVAFDPRQPGARPLNPRTNRPYSLRELADRYLYIADGPEGRPVNALYLRESGELLTDAHGAPLRQASPGDTAFTSSSPAREVVVANAAMVEPRPLSAYDELTAKLVAIRHRFPLAEDAGAITIASDSRVAYDKVVQFMDVARRAGYPDVAVTRLNFPSGLSTQKT